MSTREDQLALAEFVAGIGATFNDISDKTTSKGSGLKREKVDIKNKIAEVIKADNRLNMPTGGASRSAPPAVEGRDGFVSGPPAPPPVNPLQPLPLNELLIPLPGDFNKKVPPPLPTPAAPLQAEFQFTSSINNPLPQTPREMFTYFDKKLDYITDLVSSCIRRVDALEQKSNKKKHYSSGPK